MLVTINEDVRKSAPPVWYPKVQMHPTASVAKDAAVTKATADIAFGSDATDPTATLAGGVGTKALLAFRAAIAINGVPAQYTGQVYHPAV